MYETQKISIGKTNVKNNEINKPNPQKNNTPKYFLGFKLSFKIVK